MGDFLQSFTGDMIESQGSENLAAAMAATSLTWEDVDPESVNVGDTLRYKPLVMPHAPLGRVLEIDRDDSGDLLVTTDRPAPYSTPRVSGMDIQRLVEH